MRNKNKLVACISVAALSMGLCGCGKESVDYDIGEDIVSEGDLSGENGDDSVSSGNSENSDSDDDSMTGEGENSKQDVSALRRDLRIPKSYDSELDIDTSVSSIKSVKISDDDITVPNRDKMYTVIYDKQDMDEEYKKEVIDSLFDDDKDVRTIDINLSSSEINETTGEVLSGNYESNAYTGWRGDFFFWLIFYEDEYSGDKNYSITCLNLEDFYTEGNVHSVYVESWDGDMTNACTMTEEEAVATAEEFILSTEATYDYEDLYLVDASPLCWFADGVNVGADGYSLVLGIAVDGQEIYSPRLYGLDYLNESDTLAASVEFAIGVELNDDGIICYGSNYPMYKTGEKSAGDLITFDEAVSILTDEVPKFYAKNPTGYEEVVFNDVRLTYYIVNNGEDNTFEIVPAYTFAQHDLPGADIGEDEYDLEYERLESRPIHLFVINATNGTVIDPVEASYGTYTK